MAIITTLAEADSAVMRMFDVIELSLQDGIFGPDYISVALGLTQHPIPNVSY